MVEPPNAGVAVGPAVPDALGPVAGAAVVEGCVVDVVEVAAGWLPRLPNKLADGAAAGAVVVAVEVAVDAAEDAGGCILWACPRLPNRLGAGAADVEAGAALEPAPRLEKRLGVGAALDVAVCGPAASENEDVVEGKLNEGVLVVAGCEGFDGAAPNRGPLAAFCVFVGAKLNKEV